MSNLAICSGDAVIYWNALMIALGAASAFALGMALYIPRGGRRAEMWVLFPLAVGFSVLASRFLHWYCHAEQYAGLRAALTDYSTGSYCMPGVLFGTALAVLIVKLCFSANAARMFDCLAPGVTLGAALVRLSALFTESCRSTISITDPALQRLPLASAIVTASGAVSYRFATFFVEFLLLLAVLALLLIFLRKRESAPMKGGCPSNGNVAMMFLLLFSAVELLTDSTRYDSSFLHFNGFVSLVQIVGGLLILTVLIYYSVYAVRGDRLRARHLILWLLYLLSLAAAGVSEYMVQRHGDWYMKCYAVMTLACVLMCVSVYGMYRAASVKRRARHAA